MIRIIVSVVAVLAVTITVITMFLSVDNLSRCSDVPTNMSGCTSVDAIVAVSGGDTTARTQTAIDLYKNGWASLLIFSGAAYDKSGPSNAEVMRMQAVNQGVPREHILIDKTSETTKQNANNAVTIMTEQKVASAILVTSSYHQKRTLLEFQSQAPDVEFRSHPTSGDNRWSVWWWTTPYGWYLAVSELVKIIIFYFGGGR